jgi:RNA-directed DNA polymerase
LPTQIGGKDFDPNKEHEEDGKYGKKIFAEKVVQATAAAIDFSGFAPLLDRIVAVLNDYAVKLDTQVVAAAPDEVPVSSLR